jgi:hypothetical protein
MQLMQNTVPFNLPVAARSSTSWIAQYDSERFRHKETSSDAYRMKLFLVLWQFAVPGIKRDRAVKVVCAGGVGDDEADV